MSPRAALGLLLALVVGCGEDPRCGEIRDELIVRIRSECPPGSSCRGNPKLDQPVVSFAKPHFELLVELKERDCALPDLGAAPWFCNNGEPACPFEYTCCMEGVTPVCRRQCRKDGGAD